MMELLNRFRVRVHSTLNTLHLLRRIWHHAAIEYAEWVDGQRRQAAIQTPSLHEAEFIRRCVSPITNAQHLADVLLRIQASLDAGMSPNVTDRHGTPVLSLVASTGSVVVAELLLNRGAEVDGRNALDEPPILDAVIGYGIRRDRVDMIDCLARHRADVNVLWGPDGARMSPPMFSQSWAVSERLINQGADIFAVDGKGRNLLHHAASRSGRAGENSTELWHRLTALGVSPLAVDHSGLSAVDTAEKHRNDRVLSLFRSQQAQEAARAALRDMNSECFSQGSSASRTAASRPARAP